MTPAIDWTHVGEIIFTNVFMAGVVWGTVRQELRNLRDGVTEAKALATRAHDRIDTILEKHA